MANAIPSRLGQINGAGAVDELFLKKFAGEVLTAFAEVNVMMDKHQVRNIENGKSAQFPVMGTIGASYHTPGTELLGGTLPHAERVITIDDVLLSQSFIANIDEAKNHYEVRSNYSSEMGKALANQMDKHLLQLGVLASRGAGVVTGEPGGAKIVSANARTNTADLIAALFQASQRFDEKDVPEEERYAFLLPAQYYALAQNTSIMNRDWGGIGSYADANVLKVAGLTIVKTNHLPQGTVANGTVAAGTGNKYAGVFTNVVALVMQKQAIGTVKLWDLGMESEYQISRQGTLMVAKYAVGHGILRPACAIEIATA
jgi:hypothetical protein